MAVFADPMDAVRAAVEAQSALTHEAWPDEADLALLLLHRREREEIRLQVEDVTIRHESEGGIGKHGEIVCAIRPHPLGHGFEEVGITPLANASGGSRRDIGAIDTAKRRLNGSSTGHEGPVVLQIGMTTAPPGSPENVFSTLHGRALLCSN